MVLDADLKPLTPWLSHYECGYYTPFCTASLGNKVGLYHYAGKQIFPLQFEGIIINNKLWYANRLIIKKNGKYGVVLFSDPTKVLLDFKYDNIDYGADSIYLVTIGEKRGLFDHNFKMLLPAEFDDYFFYKNIKGEYLVTKNGKKGIYKADGTFYNKEEDIVKKYNFFENVSYFNVNDSLFWVKFEDNKWGLINPSGKLQIDQKFDSVYHYSVHNYSFIINNGKTGVMQGTKILIEPQYDRVSDFSGSGYFVVYKNNKMGLVNHRNQVIIPLEYEIVYEPSNGLVRAMNNKRKDNYYYNLQGKLMFSILNNEEIGDFSEGLLPIRIDGKAGYLDSLGKEAFPFIYEYAKPFVGRIGLLSNEKGIFYINHKGEVVEQLAGYRISNAGEYDEFAFNRERNTRKYAIRKDGKITFFDTFLEVLPYTKRTYPYEIYIKGYHELDFEMSEGLFPITLPFYKGFMNDKGKIIVPPRYVEIKRFKEGMAVVGNDRKYGYIDSTGREIVPCIINKANSFSDGLAVVERLDKFGAIDKQGKTVIPFEYNELSDFVNGFAAFKRRDNSNDYSAGYINKSSEVVIAPRFHLYTNIVEDRGFGQKYQTDSIQIFDSQGTIIKKLGIKPQYGNFFFNLGAPVSHYFREGYVSFSSNLVDRNGDCLLPLNKYSDVGDFYEGLAKFKDAGNFYGYLNPKGEVVIRPQYSYALDFSEGLAAIYSENRYGFINAAGKMTIENDFDKVGDFHEGVAWVNIKKYYAFIDNKGKLLTPFIYTDATNFKNGLARVGRGNHYFYINKQGKCVLNCK